LQRAQCSAGAVGVADRVEHDVDGRQRGRSIVDVGDKRGHAEDAIVEERVGVERTAGGAHAQQHVDRPAASAERCRGQRASGETEAPVRERFVVAAEPGERVAQALMRRCVVRLDCERRLVVLPRFIVGVVSKEHVSQVGMCQRSVRIDCERAFVDRARGSTITAAHQKRSEVVERAQIVRGPGE
jgi:hypothetical protein